ncbi:protein rep, partial [Salmonella enterica subsp. enterica serovar Kentucky]|nr:protein rep [Salmonella enterica subsp. enterica serovar Kentucky]
LEFVVKTDRISSIENLRVSLALKNKAGAMSQQVIAFEPFGLNNDPEWFLELTRQTHKRRFVATGGALKDVLKLEQETDQDMVIGD